MSIVFNPQAWVTTMQRSLKDYVQTEVENYIPGELGLEAFDVVFDYAEAADAMQKADLKKTIIHLEIDDIENFPIGIGPNIMDDVYDPGDVSNPATLTEREARGHRVNFDVGVWASDVSGGATSRLLAYEMLEAMFGGEMARVKCFTATQGVEIRSFQGGRFIIDTINDVRVFRIISAELICRVYSRKDGNEIIVPDTLDQNPLLTIDPGHIPLT